MNPWLVRFKAVVWLHLIRLVRYSLGFVNMVISEILWMLLFILGVLLFVPPEHLPAALRMAYWTLSAWMLISNFSSLIGSWTNFFISIGMVEEHLMRGISPFFTISGRVITGTTVTVAIIALMGGLFSFIFGVDMFHIVDHWLLILGFALVMIEGVFYGLSVSALAMRTSVSEQFLEILNFGMMGALIIPLTALPEAARLPYLLLPWAAPVHLIKVAVEAVEPVMVLEGLLIGLVESMAFVSLGLYLIKKADDYVKRNGVRMIGFW